MTDETDDTGRAPDAGEGGRTVESDAVTSPTPGPLPRVVAWVSRFLAAAPRPVAVVAGPRHVVLDANAAFLGLRAIDDRGGVGIGDRPLMDALAADTARAVGSVLDRAFRTGRPAHGTVSPDDADDVWHCTAWPVETGNVADPAQLVVELHPVGDAGHEGVRRRDVTERILLSALREQQLAEASVLARGAAERHSAELAAVIESMPDAVYIGTRDGISRANRTALAQFGVASIAELATRLATRDGPPDMPTDPRDPVTGASIAAARRPFARALDGATVVDEMLVRDPRSGEDRAIRCAAAPVIVDGQTVAAVVVSTDVTDRRRAETALADARESLEMALDAAEMGVWDLDLVANTARTSARHAEMFGHAEPLVPRGLDMFRERVLPEDLARLDHALARGLETKTLELEVRVRGRDASVHWVQILGRVYEDLHGRPVRMAGVTRDVTESRGARDALRRAEERVLATLEARVAERTTELAGANAALEAEVEARTRSEGERTRLRRRLADAEEAERRRLARELHDQLGQHLTAITWGLDEARRLVLADVIAHTHLAERLGQLQALAIAMTRDARYLSLELRPAELDDVGLESALATYVAQWAARYGVAADVAVTGRAERPLPAEVGTALYRIVQEALTNVAKHARARHVSVIVEKPDDEVRLIVEDDGRGFDGEATLRRAQAERRLGFAGMQERAALVGGTLTVESTPGRGTTLYVRLPAADASAAVGDAAPQPRRPPV